MMTKRNAEALDVPNESIDKRSPKSRRLINFKRSTSPSTSSLKHPAISRPAGKEYLSIGEKVGDIFDAPKNSLLVHACNCTGSWGAGIAAAFKKRYPKAYEIYRSHCLDSEKGTAPIGTALLIPPVDGENGHFIGCLLTSGHYGKFKDPPNLILSNTTPAMEDLLRQVATDRRMREVGEIRMCKINSGLFKVPWEQSKAALSSISVREDMPSSVTVYSPPG